jgi:hypothetical protein
MYKAFSVSVIFLDSLAALFVVAQAIVPSSVSNGWQFAAFVALLLLNAYGMYIQSQKTKETQDKIDGVAVKTENVHLAVNSQLDKFKAEAANQYKTSLEQGIALVKLTLEKAADAKTSALETRIAALEGKLDTERLKAVALAASTKPIDLTAKVELTPVRPIDPPARHEEIRGQTS